MWRMLSAVESLMWGGGQRAINFALAARLRGDLAVEPLRAALAKVRQKNPLVAGRVEVCNDARWYTTEGAPEFSIRTVEGDWATIVAGELTVPFPREGPLARFVLVKDGGYSTLVMVCHHCVADGLSAAYVLRDALHYLAHPTAPVEPLPELPALAELLPPLDPDLLDFARMAMSKPGEPNVFDAAAGEQLYVLPWSLDETQTATLMARCRRERTTVHAALGVAFLTALVRLSAGGPTVRCVSTPVSLRDRLRQPVGEQYGMLIQGGVKTRLDCAPGREFWVKAREFKESMQRDIADPRFFALFHTAEQILARIPYEQVIAAEGGLIVDYDLSITNLGRLDFPADDGALRLEGLYGPAVSGMPDEQVLGVATAAGRLTCTLVSRPRLLAPDAAARWKALAGNELARAVGW